MTVAEFIRLLQEYPQDIPVVDDCGLIEPRDLKILKEYYNGDCANPNCEIIDEVLYIE